MSERVAYGPKLQPATAREIALTAGSSCIQSRHGKKQSVNAGGIEVAKTLVHGSLIERTDARGRRQRHRKAARQILDQPNILEHVPLVTQGRAADAPDQARTVVGHIEDAN